MSSGAIMVAAGFACVVVALVLALMPRDRTAPSRVELRFSVVGIDDFCYFDVRRFPREALLGFLHVDAARRHITRSDVTAYVWVLPPVFASLLQECEGFAKVLLLARLRDPVPKPTRVFAYVDGWRPDTSHDVIAREAGVELLVELPRLIGPDGDHDVRAMLDAAQRG